MASIWDFFSQDAGQRRRRALDEFVSGVEKFIPPNLRPAAGAVAQMNPIQGMQDAMQAGGVVFDPEQTAEARKRAALDMGIEMAMALTPAALAARGYLTPVQGVMEGLLGGSPAQQQIAEDFGRLSADVQGVGRSIAQGDMDMLGEVFQRAREPKSVGAGATKEMLDPQRLSKIKMPSHVSEIEYKATPTGDLQQSKTISIDDLQGTTLIPAYGDRTYGGAMLEEIGGTKLNTPVEMQGGHDFMRDQRTGLWASEARAMTPKAEFIDKIIEEGEDPRMVYTAMGGQSADFSHHMADATMGLIEQSKITKKSAKEYDNFVRDKLDPNWPGILDPKARDYLHNNMTGTLRRELWQEMDKDKWKKMGFPHLGLARVAITDPKLLTVDPFSAGLSIGRPTGGGLLDLENKMPHKSYDTQIGGEYLGGLLDQVPGNLIFRDFFKTRRDAGIPTSGDQRSFMMSPYTKQLVDQQMVDEVNQYLDYSRGRM